MKLCRAAINGGLPKFLISKPFFPGSLPTDSSAEERSWQSCTPISDEDLVQRGLSFMSGPWQPLFPSEHRAFWRQIHTSPSTGPYPFWLPDLPATAFNRSISKAVKRWWLTAREGKGWSDIREGKLTANSSNISLVEMLSALCLRGTEIFAFHKEVPRYLPRDLFTDLLNNITTGRE